MSEPPTTRPSLLVRLRNPQDRLAWEEFVDLYAPLVYGYARKQGLQDADAADLTQDVLRAVAGAAGRLEYDPNRGSFRGWLFTIVRNKLRNFLASRKPGVQGAGGSSAQHLLEQQPARDNPEALWEQEYERRLFRWAAERVRSDFRDSTWQAFWLTAVEGQSAREAAEALGLTVVSVYLAKSRVLARLRQQVEQLQQE
jgi:RNA polymerase sigma-70 factor (ECF subfamily)